MSSEARRTEARLILAAAEAEARIERCHEEVACPACFAPVGQRCWALSGRGYTLRDTPNGHPHRRRWTQVVPAR